MLSLSSPVYDVLLVTFPAGRLCLLLTRKSSVVPTKAIHIEFDVLYLLRCKALL